jgi:hypothetical protein
MGEWRYRSTDIYLDTRWRWVVSFKPWHLYPRELKPPSTHWLGDWVGNIADLDAVEKRKVLLLPGFEPRPSSVVNAQTSVLFHMRVWICGLSTFCRSWPHCTFDSLQMHWNAVASFTVPVCNGDSGSPSSQRPAIAPCPQLVQFVLHLYMLYILIFPYLCFGHPDGVFQHGCCISSRT